jgi:predicted transglutaminase-like cysteine proteinase
MARAVPELPIATRAPADIALPIGLPAPAPVPVPVPAPPPTRRGPFGLAPAGKGAMAARWRALQPAIRADMQMLALCRANPKVCTPAARRFIAIVDAGLARSGLARLGEINRAVNLAIRPMSDLAQYGARDVWATPLMTFTTGAGDCEDYAIAKYVALLQAGMAAADVRLVLVHDRQNRQDHAVTAARLNGEWLILDNLTMMLRADRNEFFMQALVALGGGTDDAPPPVVAMPKPKPFLETGLLFDHNG